MSFAPWRGAAPRYSFNLWLCWESGLLTLFRTPPLQAVLANRLAQRGYGALLAKVRKTNERVVASEARAKELANQLAVVTAERDGLRGERDAAILGREAALAGAQRLRASERSAQEEARALRLQVEGLQEGLAKSQREADDFARSLEEVLGEAEVIVDENRSLTRGYNLLRNCLLQNLRVMEPNISALGAVAPARDFPLGGSSPNVPAMAGRLSILCEALGPASRSFGDSCAKTAWLEVFARLHSAGVKGWEEAVVKAEAAGSSDQRAKLPKPARQIAQNFQKSFWEARGREDARQLLLGRLRGTEPAAPVAPEVNPADEQVGTVCSFAPEFTRVFGS